MASDATCLERILARRVCPKCCASYNLLLLATPEEKGHDNRDTCDKHEKCEKCNTGLEIRKSDTQKFTKERLQHFHEHIEPILDKAKEFYEFIAIDTDNTGYELIELEKKYKNLFM
jgi:hypothetical protein